MKYLEGEDLSDEEIVTGLLGALKQGTMVPLLYCAPEQLLGMGSGAGSRESVTSAGKWPVPPVPADEAVGRASMR